MCYIVTAMCTTMCTSLCTTMYTSMCTTMYTSLCTTMYRTQAVCNVSDVTQETRPGVERSLIYVVMWMIMKLYVVMWMIMKLYVVMRVG